MIVMGLKLPSSGVRVLQKAVELEGNNLTNTLLPSLAIQAGHPMLRASNPLLTHATGLQHNAEGRKANREVKYMVHAAFYLRMEGKSQAALFRFPNFRVFKTVTLLSHIFLPWYFKFDSLFLLDTVMELNQWIKKSLMLHINLLVWVSKEMLPFNSDTTAAAWGRENKLGRPEGWTCCRHWLWNLDRQTKQ